MIDINAIKEALPHRYPMLLVDRVLEVSEDEIVALKNVTVNEPFFNGHFQSLLKFLCSYAGHRCAKFIFIVHLSELYCKTENKKALFSLVRAKMI